VLALLLALVGCGGGAPVKPVVTGLDELPLLELSIRSSRGAGSDLRVRADGRLEVRTPEADWRPIATYDDGELDELRAEMARADDPPLPAVVEGPARPGSNPTRMTWRLRLADHLREVVVEEWRDGVLPRLERLYQRLFTIPRGPVVESIWRVRVDGDVVERRVVGEPSAAPVLRSMLGALYGRPHPLTPVGRAEPPDERLVDIGYIRDGAPDGRAFLTHKGETNEVTSLSEPELQALRDAIAQTGWAALPDPITG
jgi:hypothetical protein